MIHPALGVALVLAVMLVLLLGLRLLQRLVRPHPELTRKAMHVAMGLVVLSFPWLFDSAWPVIALGLASAALLAGLRAVNGLKRGLGSVIAGVERQSFGEIYYPLTVALLFAVSGGDKLLFTIPILILALADAVAALIGMQYGRLRYTTADGLKSAEGSVAFFTVAFLSVHVPLLLFSDVGRAETLLVGLILGLIVMLVEAASWRGLDNVFVPLGAYALLVLYIDEPVAELVWRLGATGLLVGFVFLWRRRSSLDDSALIGAALYGYATWMFCGWTWLIAPATLFIAHALLWPHAATGQQHKVYAIVSVTAAGMLWVFVDVFTGHAAAFFPYNVSFAAHLAIIGVSRLPWKTGDEAAARGHWSHPLLHAAWASAVGLLPALAIEGAIDRALNLADLARLMLIGGLAVVMAAGAFFLLLPRLYRPSPRPAAIHIAGAVLGLLASLAAAASPALGKMMTTTTNRAHATEVAHAVPGRPSGSKPTVRPGDPGSRVGSLFGTMRLSSDPSADGWREEDADERLRQGQPLRLVHRAVRRASSAAGGAGGDAAAARPARPRLRLAAGAHPDLRRGAGPAPGP